MPEEKVEVLEGTMTEPKVLSGTPQPNLIDQVEDLLKAVEKLPTHRLGNLLTITKTDKIKVYYAQMPIDGLAIPYLFHVLEPITLIPQIYKTTIAANMIQEHNNKPTVIDRLKLHILEQYRSNFSRKLDRDALRKAGYGWLISVNEVELIECDLLVPKSNSKPKTEAV